MTLNTPAKPVQADMHPTRSIIILVREMTFCDEALRTAKTLQRSGACVDLFCLCPSEQWDACDAGVLHHRGSVHCCTVDAAIACRMGIDCLSLDDMADRIKHAEMVIPY